MNTKQIKRQHVKQDRCLAQFMNRVRSRVFVYHGRNPREALRAKLYFLAHLKRQMKAAFCFNDYQAEFVVNEAMNRVLRHSPERLLVAFDTKKAEKLTRASFVLGHHYFRFIATML